jgi:hypothetical protein
MPEMDGFADTLRRFVAGKAPTGTQPLFAMTSNRSSKATISQGVSPPAMGRLL